MNLLEISKVNWQNISKYITLINFHHIELKSLPESIFRQIKICPSAKQHWLHVHI